MQTVKLYHGTLLLSDYEYQTKNKIHRSFDLGNAYFPPGISTFLTQTITEAYDWALVDAFYRFKEFVEKIYIEKDLNYLDMFKSYRFELDDEIQKDPESFLFKSSWDPVTGKNVVSESTKTQFFKAMDYFERHEFFGFVLEIESDPRYVSFGHTATVDEFTTRDPNNIITHVGAIPVAREGVMGGIIFVPDDYVDDYWIRNQASMLNRGETSYLLEYELEYQVMENFDLYLNVRDKRDPIGYMKKHDIHFPKLSREKRDEMVNEARAYLKEKYPSIVK